MVESVANFIVIVNDVYMFRILLCWCRNLVLFLRDALSGVLNCGGLLKIYFVLCWSFDNSVV